MHHPTTSLNFFGPFSRARSFFPAVETLLETKHLKQFESYLEILIPLGMAQSQTELVPAFSCVNSPPFSYQFALTYEDTVVPFHPVKENVLFSSDLKPSTAELRIDHDIAIILAEIPKLSLVFRVSGVSTEELSKAQWFISLARRTFSDKVPKSSTEPIPDAPPNLEIPVPRKRSQLSVPVIGRRICSPTSVSMVLPVEAPIEDVAERTYCHKLDMYGIWPYAIHAANSYGVEGTLLYFASWSEVQQVLIAGFPIIASIRYGANEITDAALPRAEGELSGHLVVIHGYEAGRALVYDPAAPSEDEVPRAYRIEELEKVWFERSGIGYVLFSGRAGSCEAP